MSPARLRAARLAAVPTPAELAARRRRRPMGITQAELARRVGHAGPGAVSQWERGRHRADVGSLAAVARALNVDPLDLLEPDAPVTLTLLRIRAGLTQAEVSAAIGVSRGTWSQIENGRRPLWADELDAVARALRVSTARVVAATRTTEDTAPQVEDLPADLVERLSAYRRPGESLVDTLNRLVPPYPAS